MRRVWENALRGILDAGGDIRKDWNLEDALRTGDRAVGVNVLQPLYTRMKDKPVGVDLDSLWMQLGVRSDGASVHFDDTAHTVCHPSSHHGRRIRGGAAFPAFQAVHGICRPGRRLSVIGPAK